MKKITSIKTNEGKIHTSSAISKKGFSGLINPKPPQKSLNASMMANLSAFFDSIQSISTMMLRMRTKIWFPNPKYKKWNHNMSYFS